jgi:hypothetical protein
LIPIHRLDLRVQDDYVCHKRGFGCVCFEVHGHEQKKDRKQILKKS